MNESALNGEIDRVRRGRLSRRAFVVRMARLGLSAPVASLMLTHAGIAQPQPATPYAPAANPDDAHAQVRHCAVQ